MRLISLNVGGTRIATYKGRTVSTGIFKTSVAHSLAVSHDNVQGDAQADLRVHGGADKAVYGYPSEHYQFWEGLLSMHLDWGAFGENLTTEGLSEDRVCIGDLYRIGTVTLKVTQPREPCYKLAMKLAREDIIELFRQSGRSGFYFSVVDEGHLAPGDSIHRVRKSPYGVSIADVNQLHMEPDNQSLLARVLEVPDLAATQRKYLEKRLRGAR
jgi:MOSC domain-containing protein YiiM